MPQASIRILIVDDHPVVRKGLAATIDPEPDMKVIASASNGRDAVQLFRQHRPEVTIMDLTLTPDMSGAQTIQAIRSEFPEARVIALSAHQGDESIYQALHAGARTFLLKDTLSEELISAIREVHAGNRPIPPFVAGKLADRMTMQPLTPRELAVLKLMAKGLRNKEIAAQLGIADATTQGHVKSIHLKLGVHDRTEAVTDAIRRGIIHLE